VSVNERKRKRAPPLAVKQEFWVFNETEQQRCEVRVKRKQAALFVGMLPVALSRALRAMKKFQQVRLRPESELDFGSPLMRWLFFAAKGDDEVVDASRTFLREGGPGVQAIIVR